MASVEAELSIREQTCSEVAREKELPITRSSPPPEPSSTAILTSVFGWSVAPSAPPPLSTTASPSWSRASSVAPQGTPTAPSPAPFVSPFTAPSTAPYDPQTPRRSSGIHSTNQNKTPSFRPTSFDTVIPWSPRGSVAPERRRDTSLLHCSLCLRRLGLWAAGSAPRASRPTNGENAGSALPQKARQIDLLREHRSHPCLLLQPTPRTEGFPLLRHLSRHFCLFQATRIRRLTRNSRAL